MFNNFLIIFMMYVDQLYRNNYSDGAPGWLSRLSIWLQLRSWSHSLWVRAPCWALCWQCGAWLGFILSLAFIKTQSSTFPPLPFFNVLFIFEREREREPGRGREGETQNPKQTPGSLWAVGTQPDAGLELTNCEIMTWAEVGRLTDWATQVPLNCGSFQWPHYWLLHW